MRSADTSPEAHAIQREIYRKMSGERRLALAFEMSRQARAVALEGIRRDHPDWPDSELLKEFLRRQFPADQIPPPLR